MATKELKGCLIKRKRCRWELQVSLGKDPVTQKYRRVSRSFQGNKDDAQKALDALKEELAEKMNREKLYSANAKMTFSEYCDVYIEGLRIDEEMKPSTIYQKQNKLKIISKYIGNMRLCDIEPTDIRDMLQKYKVETKCCNRTYNGTRMIVRTALQSAVDLEIIPSNPAAKVKALEAKPVNRRSLTMEEVQDFLSVLDSSERDICKADPSLDGMCALIPVIAGRIALNTGMRLGEVLGLQWQFVDFEERCINVEYSYNKVNGLVPPKSHAGKRDISIDADTAQHLKAYKEYQRKALETVSTPQRDNTFVLLSRRLNPLDTGTFEAIWHVYRDAIGYEGLLFHELRHTQATMLLASGVDIKTVQTRIGHADAAMTLNHYAHAQKENDKQAADLLGNLFHGKDSRIVTISAKQRVCG